MAHGWAINNDPAHIDEAWRVDVVRDFTLTRRSYDSGYGCMRILHLVAFGLVPHCMSTPGITQWSSVHKRSLQRDAASHYAPPQHDLHANAMAGFHPASWPQGWLRLLCPFPPHYDSLKLH